MKCEKCLVESEDDELIDYCAKCGRNLCDNCMAKGCCDNKPAKSGMKEGE